MTSLASHLTFLSRQASQLGSFLLCRYALLWFELDDDEGSCACDGPGVPAADSLDGIDSLPMVDVAVTGVYGV
jgi:hypothetical protein